MASWRLSDPGGGQGCFSSFCAMRGTPWRLPRDLPRHLLASQIVSWGAELWSLICYLICFLKKFSESLKDKGSGGQGRRGRKVGRGSSGEGAVEVQ